MIIAEASLRRLVYPFLPKECIEEYLAAWNKLNELAGAVWQLDERIEKEQREVDRLKGIRRGR